VGAEAARRLGTLLRDTDAEVEAVAGRTVADIFVELGEPAFRSWERAAVADGLTGFDGVLALGGGAVLDADTRALLRGRPVVYLRVGLGDAMRRVGLTRDRPLLMGNVRGRWLSLMEARRPYYEQVARWTVDTDGRPASAVVDEVVSLVEGAP
jgi:shikimate kinase